ncbi:MAG: isoprenylcysteine carboxylmethyltransferase family protein [Acidobacteriota bacterium]
MELPDSRILYTALVAAVAMMRVVELAVSRRNITRLLQRGATEAGRSLYPLMVVIHAGLLVSCVAEVWILERPFVPLLAAPMLGAMALAAGLRWWVISTLGDRWSTRVVFVPGEPPVTDGPFRWIRHPNYLAVILEFLALPLVHTAWVTAVVFGLANGIVLASRIRTEEAALSADSAYPRLMRDRPRFHPGHK